MILLFLFDTLTKEILWQLNMHKQHSINVEYWVSFTYNTYVYILHIGTPYPITTIHLIQDKHMAWNIQYMEEKMWRAKTLTCQILWTNNGENKKSVIINYGVRKTEEKSGNMTPYFQHYVHSNIVILIAYTTFSLFLFYLLFLFGFTQSLFIRFHILFILWASWAH